MSSNPQAKRWMITLNNPSFKESETIYNICKDEEQVKYAVWCAENEDEENATPHYHIYISFNRMWRFNRIKNLLPRARIEKATKCELACFRYITKGNRGHTVEPFYMEFGHRNERTGEVSERTKRKRAEDMAREEVVLQVRQKKLKYEDLTCDQLLDTKLCAAVERTLRCSLGPFRDNLHICCFVSPTGWGKSFTVWDTFKEVCTCEFGASQEWFVSAEKDVMLFDEFCGQIRCQKMLKYLDKYPIALPIKGSHRPCYWKAIFICSNTSPDDWYTKINERTGMRESTIPDDVRKALYRRLGYDAQGPSTIGETHVYDPMLYDMQTARNEMKQIVERIKQQIESVAEQEEEQQPAAAAAAEEEDSEPILASYMLDSPNN